MNGSKKNILLICDANLNRAPRVRATYNALKNDFNFTMAGYDKPPFTDVDYIQIPRKKKIKRRNISWHLNYPGPIRKMCSLLIKAYLFIVEPKEDKRSIKEQHFHLFDNVSCDLIINHHLNTFELALALKNTFNVPLVSNLHEYYPREFEDQVTWQQYEAPKKIQICKTLLPEADLVFSVCPGIQKEYKKEFGIDSHVMRNDKPYMDIQPSAIQEGRIRLIHHGAALKSRFLHHLIDAVGPLGEQFTLDLMLVPTQQDYFDLLTQKCSQFSHINMIEPVNPHEIVEFINQYDVGVYLLEPINFNSQMALPNKLFEFIQARLALAITPNQEMANIVNTYDLGVVCQDYGVENFREMLASLSKEQVANFKMKSHEHAYTLSSDATAGIIRKEINALFT